MGIWYRQDFRQSSLQPSVFGPCPALRATAISTGVILPVAMVATITNQELAAQCASPTSDDATPCFGLNGAKGVRFEIRRAKVAKRIS